MGEYGFKSPPPPPPLPWLQREQDGGDYTERKFPDEVLAVWEFANLPEGAAVSNLTLIPYRGEKAVVAWRAGKVTLPTGDIQPGETIDAAIARIAVDQAGILEPVATHLGHFTCRATVHSKLQPAGTVTYQPIYGVEVGSLADFPSDQSYERRQISQRDLNTLIRSAYLEFRREYADALDRFLLDRIKSKQTG